MFGNLSTAAILRGGSPRRTGAADMIIAHRAVVMDASGAVVTTSTNPDGLLAGSTRHS